MFELNVADRCPVIPDLELVVLLRLDRETVALCSEVFRLLFDQEPLSRGELSFSSSSCESSLS